MTNDSRHSNESNFVTAAMGQAGSAFATAASDFFSRAFEIGTRRAGEAMTQALASGQRPGSEGSWVDALLAKYREYLGEMGAALPMVAQRIARESQQEVGQRLLFSAPAEDAPALRGLLGEPRITTTWTVVDRILGGAVDPKQFTRRLQGYKTELLRAAGLIDSKDVRRLPRLFDDLKYEFRRKGVPALPGIFKLLGEFQDGKLGGVLEHLERLTRMLGEKVVTQVLERRTATGLVNDILNDTSSRVEGEFPPEVAKLFKSIGIELSHAVSALSTHDHCLILDHDRDKVYEVRRADGERINGGRTSGGRIEGGRIELYGVEHGRRYHVDASQLLLPVRVFDASQGLAMWTVDKQVVQETLDNATDRRMRVWDSGGGRTSVVLFMVDYREGDLGAYRELGLACFAAPKKDPLAVGMHVLGELPVTTRLSCDAGRRIWGYPKRDVGADNLTIEYGTRHARCILRDGAGKALVAFEVPRGGDGSSVDVPAFSYTLKGGVVPRDGTWHRTVIKRSGRGEGVRGGGLGVALGIDSASLPSDEPKKGAFELGALLWLLGIVDDHGVMALTPSLSAWTENMSAELSAPAVVPAPPPDL